MAVLLTQAVCASVWTPMGWGLYATNRLGNLPLLSLLNAIFTILLALLSAPRFGVVGVALSSLFADVVFGMIPYPIIAAGFLRIPSRVLFVIVAQVGLILASLAALLALVSRMTSGPLRLPAIASLALLWTGLAALYLYKRSVPYTGPEGMAPPAQSGDTKNGSTIISLI
jgi:hypothetical protein